MARVKTFTNWDGVNVSGKLLPSDLNLIQDDYERAFSTHRPLVDRAHRFDAPAAGIYLLGWGEGNAGVAATSALAGLAVFRLEPADLDTGAPSVRAGKYVLRASALVNATAPAATFNVRLYPISAVAGAAGAVSVTLGTHISGTAAIATPAASSLNVASSPDLATFAAGYYALGVEVSAAAAAGSSVAMRAQLLARQA